MRPQRDSRCQETKNVRPSQCAELGLVWERVKRAFNLIKLTHKQAQSGASFHHVDIWVDDGETTVCQLHWAMGSSIGRFDCIMKTRKIDPCSSLAYRLCAPLIGGGIDVVIFICGKGECWYCPGQIAYRACVDFLHRGLVLTSFATEYIHVSYFRIHEQ